MKLTNIGGATAILEHGGRRILFDPWLNEGILHGSWFHWPKIKLGVADMGRLDFIYISHIHEDHCSPETIRHINRDAEIVIMDREPEVPNFIKRFLKANRFDFKRVHLIRPQTPAEIAPGLVVDMVTADPANEYNWLVDSGMILKWGGKTLYNANDCAPYAASISYIKEKYGVVDLALLPYAGGSGYPGCYTNLSHEEKIRERDRIFAMRMNDFVESVRALDPRCVMPFADQYVMGGSRGYLNRYSPHPPSPGYVAGPLGKAGFAEKLVLLNSGQSYDLATERKSPDEAYHSHTEEDRDNYIRELSDRKYDYEKVVMRDGIPLERMFSIARAKLWTMQEKRKEFPQSTIYLNVTNQDRMFKLDYRNPAAVEIPSDTRLEEPYLKISLDSTLFAMCLINHIPWNMADAFLDYERVPNVYDPKAYALLNHLTL